MLLFPLCLNPGYLSIFFVTRIKYHTYKVLYLFLSLCLLFLSFFLFYFFLSVILPITTTSSFLIYVSLIIVCPSNGYLLCIMSSVHPISYWVIAFILFILRFLFICILCFLFHPDTFMFIISSSRLSLSSYILDYSTIGSVISFSSAIVCVCLWFI